MRRIKEILLIAFVTIIILVIVLATNNKVSRDIIGSEYRLTIILALSFLISLSTIFLLVYEFGNIIKILIGRGHVNLEKDVHTRLTALRLALIDYRNDKDLRIIIWQKMTHYRLVDQLSRDADELEAELSEYGNVFEVQLAELRKLKALRDQQDKQSPKTD
ncbi:MAG: hypothetical protein R3B39_01025 [Candidatus Paceibacterota bacterium]